MRLHVDDGPDPHGWDRAVASAGGTVFQSSAWAHYARAEQPSARPLYMSLVAEDGGVIGYALGFSQQSSRPVLAHLNRRIWLDAAPVVPSENTAVFLALIEAHARDWGAVDLHIGSFASLDMGGLLAGRGFRRRSRLEFEIPLTGSEAELFQGLGGVRRQTIRKAQRHGVSICELSDAVGLAELRRLQAESASRIVARGGPLVEARGNGNEPLRVLIEQGVGRVFVARLHEQVVSAGLFTYFNGLAYFAIAGHAREGLRAQAPALMLWEAMKFHKQLGATRFNLGGCGADAVLETSSEHGVYVYKKDFNGRILSCTSGSKVLRPGMHRTLGFLKTMVSVLSARMGRAKDQQ